MRRTAGGTRRERVAAGSAAAAANDDCSDRGQDGYSKEVGAEDGQHRRHGRHYEDNDGTDRCGKHFQKCHSRSFP